MSRGCERIIGQRTPTKWCDEESARCSGQVGWLCPALPQHARCRPQHIQSSTPPHLPVDAEGLPSRSGGAVAECCCSGMKSACSRLTSACDRCRDKAGGVARDFMFGTSVFCPGGLKLLPVNRC